VCLMVVALSAYQLLERLYRRGVDENAEEAERCVTAETLMRTFRPYGLIARQSPLGLVVHATRLTPRQRHVLLQLGFPTPTQLLASVLPRPPDTCPHLPPPPCSLPSVLRGAEYEARIPPPPRRDSPHVHLRPLPLWPALAAA